MNLIDTRELDERLDELIELDVAETDAKDELTVARDDLAEATVELDLQQKLLDDARETDINAETERITFDIQVVKKRLEDAEKYLEKCEDDLADAALSDEDRAEYKELRMMEEEIYGFHDGVTLIPESDFEDYCQEFCEEIGDIPNDFPSYIVIDWNATSNNLRADYSSLEYKGEDYLYRAE